MRLALLSLVALCLASCTTTVSLDYRPRSDLKGDGTPIIAVDTFQDQRGLEPHFLGTVGLLGVDKLTNASLERVVLTVPVDQTVTNAVAQALSARGHLAPAGNAKYRLTGEVLDLHCELLSNPYAAAHLRIRAIDNATGRIVFQKDSHAQRQSPFFLRGSRDPVVPMREVTSRALQDAVDQVIDSAAFREAVGL